MARISRVVGQVVRKRCAQVEQGSAIWTPLGVGGSHGSRQKPGRVYHKIPAPDRPAGNTIMRSHVRQKEQNWKRQLCVVTKGTKGATGEEEDEKRLIVKSGHLRLRMGLY